MLYVFNGDEDILHSGVCRAGDQRGGALLDVRGRRSAGIVPLRLVAAPGDFRGLFAGGCDSGAAAEGREGEGPAVRVCSDVVAVSDGGRVRLRVYQLWIVPLP